MQLSEEQMSKLCHVIMETMVEEGLKATTMDLVASKMRISKRTLYEIFSSKEEMLVKALETLSNETNKLFLQILEESENTLVALLRIFDFHRHHLNILNVNFFKDMDRLYRTIRPIYEDRKDMRQKFTENVFLTGVKEGLFRKDLNYNILTRTLEIQMESLKRMEELFSADTSLLEIYNTISFTFLRGIVTQKGMEILEQHYDNIKTNNSISNK